MAGDVSEQWMAEPKPVRQSGESTWTVRDELKATLAARRDLGPEYDEALVDAFLAKIERRIDQRVDARLAALGRRGLARRSSTARLAILLTMAIPLSAVAGSTGGLPALVLLWGVLLFLALRE